MNTHIFTCPCCGYRGLNRPAFEGLLASQVPVDPAIRPPYAQHFGIPSFEVCACCGFEFGNDDEPGTATPVSFNEYLLEWIGDGSVWFDESFRPDKWTIKEQLEKAKITMPHKYAW